MIDIEKAKQELINHVKEQKIENEKVNKKLEHILRVANISKKIATELKLTPEQIELAELIGLLHDIGRFEQYKMTDTTKFNHGQAGVEILKKDNYLRKYIEEEKYDNVILTAVYEHNRYELSANLTKEQELFCKIIKDADKIDLIYEGAEIYWQKQEDIAAIENGKLSSKMLEDFYQHKLADIRNKVSKADEIVRFISYIFDINFSYSRKIIKESGNVNKMIERFDYKREETKVEMEKIKKIIKEELKKGNENWAKNY